MAEEVRPGGPPQPDSVWGLYEAQDAARWSLLAPTGGDVMVVQIPVPLADEEGVDGFDERWEPLGPCQKFGSLQARGHHQAVRSLQQKSGTHPLLCQLVGLPRLRGGNFPRTSGGDAAWRSVGGALCQFQWKEAFKTGACPGSRGYGRLGLRARMDGRGGPGYHPRGDGGRGSRVESPSRLSTRKRRGGQKISSGSRGHSRHPWRRPEGTSSPLEGERGREEPEEEQRIGATARSEALRSTSSSSCRLRGCADLSPCRSWDRYSHASIVAGAVGDVENDWRPQGPCIGGAKRRHYEELESEEGEQLDQWPASFESCCTSPRGRGWRRLQPRRRRPVGKPEEEKEKEEKEREEEKEEEVQEGSRRRWPAQWKQLKQFKYIVKEQQRQRRLQGQLGQRVSTSTQEVVRKEAWQHHETASGTDRGAIGYSAGRRPQLPHGAYRNKGDKLLSPLGARKRRQQLQQGRPGNVFDCHVAGFATSRIIGPARGRTLVPILSPSTSTNRWSLGSCSTFRNIHAGYLHSSWPSSYSRGKETCQDDGESKGSRFYKRTWQLWPKQLELRQRQLEQQWWRQQCRPLERQRKEGQNRQRKRQFVGQEPRGARRIRPREAVDQGAGTREGRGVEVKEFYSASMLLEAARSLSEVGLALWFLLFKSEDPRKDEVTLGAAPEINAWWKKVSRGLRVTRASRALFPLPTIWEGALEMIGDWKSFSSLIEDGEKKRNFAFYCWCELSVLFCNRLFDGTLAFGQGNPTKAQLQFLESIESQVKRILSEDVDFSWKWNDVREDFKKKNISYTGEEVCKAEPLCVQRIEPALPPPGHGGSISCLDWVKGNTKHLSSDPRSCVVPDIGQPLPRLQAKMHFEKDEGLKVAKLLVERKLCRWVEEKQVLRYRGEKVLNGMFGVPKSKVLPSGKTVLRTIMNHT